MLEFLKMYQVFRPGLILFLLDRFNLFFTYRFSHKLCKHIDFYIDRSHNTIYALHKYLYYRMYYYCKATPYKFR